MNQTTIAAISTALSEAGISVIRISGEDAIPIAEKIFRSISGKKLCDMSGYTCAFGTAIADGQTIDECIATVFRAPKSYTGEDVVELSCHGGVAVTRGILRAVLDAGAVPAEAGEFTKRAFLNGKLDLIEAESVMNLIGAKSAEEAKAALKIKDGYLSKKIHAIKSDLMNIAAHLEAWADYPEEDIPEVCPDTIQKTIDRSESALDSLIKRYDNGKFFGDGIDTVIVGKPNVGKSTLMNYLSGYDRSIVTSIPGTTRDTVEQQIRIGQYKLNLIDTAGIRETEDEVEKIGVERAKTMLERAKLVLFMVDGTAPLDDADREIISILDAATPIITIVNKIDLCRDSSQYTTYNELTEELNGKNITPKHNFFLSIKNAGAEETEQFFSQFKELIGRIFLGKDCDYDSDVILYNERQRELIGKARQTLGEVSEALSNGETFDAITVLIEECIGHLAELTGESVTEEIVDRVFHNFCVGK